MESKTTIIIVGVDTQNGVIKEEKNSRYDNLTWKILPHRKGKYVWKSSHIAGRLLALWNI
jgi:hypothetical protein